jgi:hypothetical protein
MIVLDNISKAFDGHDAVKSFSATMHTGEVLSPMREKYRSAVMTSSITRFRPNQSLAMLLTRPFSTKN